MRSRGIKLVELGIVAAGAVYGGVKHGLPGAATVLVTGLALASSIVDQLLVMVHLSSRPDRRKHRLARMAPFWYSASYLVASILIAFGALIGAWHGGWARGWLWSLAGAVAGGLVGAVIASIMTVAIVARRTRG